MESLSPEASPSASPAASPRSSGRFTYETKIAPTPALQPNDDTANAGFFPKHPAADMSMYHAWNSRTLPTLELERLDIAIDPLNTDVMIKDSNLVPILEILSEEFVSSADVLVDGASWRRRQVVKRVFDEAVAAASDVGDESPMDSPQSPGIGETGWEGIRMRFVKAVVDVVREQLEDMLVVMGKMDASDIASARVSRRGSATGSINGDRGGIFGVNATEEEIEAYRQMIANKNKMIESLSKRAERTTGKVNDLRSAVMDMKLRARGFSLDQIEALVERNHALEEENVYLYNRAFAIDITSNRDRTMRMNDNVLAEHPKLIKAIKKYVRLQPKWEKTLMETHDVDAARFEPGFTSDTSIGARGNAALQQAQQMLDDRILGLPPLPIADESMDAAERQLFEQQLAEQEKARREKREQMLRQAATGVMDSIASATLDRFANINAAMEAIQKAQAEAAKQQQAQRPSIVREGPSVVDLFDQLNSIRAQLNEERDSLLTTVKSAIIEGRNEVAMQAIIAQREAEERELDEFGESASNPTPRMELLTSQRRSTRGERTHGAELKTPESDQHFDSTSTSTTSKYPKPASSALKTSVRKPLTTDMHCQTDPVGFTSQESPFTFPQEAPDGHDSGDEPRSGEELSGLSDADGDQTRGKHGKHRKKKKSTRNKGKGSPPGAKLPLETSSGKEAAVRTKMETKFKSAIDAAFSGGPDAIATLASHATAQPPGYPKLSVKLPPKQVRKTTVHNTSSPGKSTAPPSTNDALKYIGTKPTTSPGKKPIGKARLAPLKSFPASNATEDGTASEPHHHHPSKALGKCGACGEILRCEACGTPAGTVMDEDQVKEMISVAMTSGEAKQALLEQQRNAKFRVAAANAVLRKRQSSAVGAPQFDHSLDAMFARAEKMKAYWKNRHDQMIKESKTIAKDLHVRLVFALYKQSHLLRVRMPTLRQMLSQAQEAVKKSMRDENSDDSDRYDWSSSSDEDDADAARRHGREKSSRSPSPGGRPPAHTPAATRRSLEQRSLGHDVPQETQLFTGTTPPKPAKAKIEQVIPQALASEVLALNQHRSTTAATGSRPATQSMLEASTALHERRNKSSSIQGPFIPTNMRIISTVRPWDEEDDDLDGEDDEDVEDEVAMPNEDTITTQPFDEDSTGDLQPPRKAVPWWEEKGVFARGNSRATHQRPGPTPESVSSPVERPTTMQRLAGDEWTTSVGRRQTVPGLAQLPLETSARIPRRHHVATPAEELRNRALQSRSAVRPITELYRQQREADEREAAEQRKAQELAESRQQRGPQLYSGLRTKEERDEALRTAARLSTHARRR